MPWPKGVPKPPEFRQRVSETLKGRPKSDETRQRMSAAQKGKTLSAETRAKLSVAHTGKMLTEEHRAKIARAMTGRPGTTTGLAWTAEQRARFIESRRGLPGPNTGKTFSPEWRENIAKAARGRVTPPEVIAARAVTRDRNLRTNRRYHSKLEEAAGVMLEPLGFERAIRLGNHTFDFGSRERHLLVEVNGCYWHDHVTIEPACPIQPNPRAAALDARVREIAGRRGFRLIELWECERPIWPQLFEELLDGANWVATR